MPSTVAVVFDLDGTLIDSAPDLHVAANRLLAEHELAPLTLAQVRSMVGEGVARLVERLFRAAGRPLDEPGLRRAADRFRALYLERACVLTRPMRGASACLDTLAAAGRRLALCTNKPEAHTRVILNALGLAARFDTVVGGDTLAVRKPDPAPLLKSLGDVGAAPSSGLFIGDSATDLETARAAGVRVGLVEGGYARTPVREMPADHHLTSLDDLPGLVATLAAEP